MKIEKLAVHGLYILTELFDYNNVEQMISKCTHDIQNGYCEFTVGVEDDNFGAIHMYQALGFNEFLLRKREEYQGDAYEYNLYLKR